MRKLLEKFITLLMPPKYKITSYDGIYLVMFNVGSYMTDWQYVSSSDTSGMWLDSAKRCETIEDAEKLIVEHSINREKKTHKTVKIFRG